MYKIHEFVKEIITNSIEIKDFDFQKTASDNNSTPRFKVTLGVMPDYLYDGVGMRIDGISKGKTAEKYGLHADITAPSKQSPSMLMALDQYIKEANKRKR